MSQFLQRLQKIKQEKIAQYKAELVAAEATQLQSLISQVEQLRLKNERTQKTRSMQAESRRVFEIEMRERFLLENQRQRLLSLFWDDVTTRHFKKSEYVTHWLKQHIDAVKEMSVGGVMYAGESYSAIKKMTLPKNISLEKDTSLAKIKGFIFKAETVQVDSTLPTFLADLYTHNQSFLYQTAFESSSKKRAEA